MKYNLHAHTFAWMAALSLAAAGLPAPHPAPAADAKPAEAVVDGQQLVRQAARDLAQLSSLQANLAHRANLLGQQLVGSGIYVHLVDGADLLLRLELKLQLSGQTASIQQIADGQFLWVRRDLGQQSTLGRVDLERVRHAAGQGPHAALSQFDSLWLSLGGLPKLLAGLDDAFDFGPARADAIRTQSGTLDVWIVQGQWKPEQLAKLVHPPGSSRERPTIDDLPAHLPHSVTLVLSREQGLPAIPYRIDYRRFSDAVNETGQRASHSVVSMEVYDLRLDPPVDRRAFRYSPGDQAVVDQTELLLNSLR